MMGEFRSHRFSVQVLITQPNLW